MRVRSRISFLAVHKVESRLTLAIPVTSCAADSMDYELAVSFRRWRHKRGGIVSNFVFVAQVIFYGQHFTRIRVWVK